MSLNELNATPASAAVSSTPGKVNIRVASQIVDGVLTCGSLIDLGGQTKAVTYLAQTGTPQVITTAMSGEMIIVPPNTSGGTINVTLPAVGAALVGKSFEFYFPATASANTIAFSDGAAHLIGQLIIGGTLPAANLVDLSAGKQTVNWVGSAGKAGDRLKFECVQTGSASGVYLYMVSGVSGATGGFTVS